MHSAVSRSTMFIVTLVKHLGAEVDDVDCCEQKSKIHSKTGTVDYNPD